jgi:hypothetical protein
MHSLLHISIHPDHPEGAYAVPFVELSAKYIVTSFAVLWQHLLLETHVATTMQNF